jgi:ArsR family transcriptional regulator
LLLTLLNTPDISHLLEKQEFMVYAKTQLFENELQTSSELFKALGHPARLAILKYLAETKTCITGDFADELPLSRTTVNQHLKELKDAGLIVGTIEGAKTCYCLDLDKLRELKSISENFFGELIASEPFCCK